MSFLLCFFCGMPAASGQTSSFDGQASGWITFTPDNSLVSQTGLRYIPEFTFEQKFHDDLERRNGFVAQ